MQSGYVCLIHVWHVAETRADHGHGLEDEAIWGVQ